VQKARHRRRYGILVKAGQNTREAGTDLELLQTSMKDTKHLDERILELMR
jgi:hypothetical protein